MAISGVKSVEGRAASRATNTFSLQTGLPYTRCRCRRRTAKRRSDDELLQRGAHHVAIIAKPLSECSRKGLAEAALSQTGFSDLAAGVHRIGLQQATVDILDHPAVKVAHVDGAWPSADIPALELGGTRHALDGGCTTLRLPASSAGRVRARWRRPAVCDVSRRIAAGLARTEAAAAARLRAAVASAGMCASGAHQQSAAAASRGSPIRCASAGASFVHASEHRRLWRNTGGAPIAATASRRMRRLDSATVGSVAR